MIGVMALGRRCGLKIRGDQPGFAVGGRRVEMFFSGPRFTLPPDTGSNSGPRRWGGRGGVLPGPSLMMSLTVPPRVVDGLSVMAS
jgi:hypothetical protein